MERRMNGKSRPPPRRGPGRPLGAINKRNEQAIELARKTGKLPHEIMLQIAQASIGAKLKGWGQVSKDDKKWALHASANYFAPKMTATNHSGHVYIMSLPQEALDRLNVVELSLMEKVFGKLAGSDGHDPVALLPAPAYDPDE